MIASVGRTGAWPQAGRISALVLLAALARAAIEPMGEGMATAAFATVLLAGMVLTRPTSPLMGEGWSGGAAYSRWNTGRSLLGGLVVAALIVAPGLPALAGAGAGHASRGLDGWWAWAAVTALVATLEEVAIRGALQGALTRGAGTLPAIAAGAAVFALIHLPRYGLGGLPLDFAVGVALGGLRAVSGRVLPCAVAHTAADWAAWWMA
ncbi:MAG: CPBP family intramembrane metalloprotease [Chloroflexi bacterium]|nr:MAG: CPBP family intramembrane metalloprotease [Chloroflexota bacterium]